MKKILSIFLIFVLMLSSTVNVCAADSTVYFVYEPQITEVEIPDTTVEQPGVQNAILFFGIGVILAIAIVLTYIAFAKIYYRRKEEMYDGRNYDSN